MSTSIPLSQPDITQREIDAVADVMRSGTLSIGPKLEEFEAAVAKISGRTHAVGVSSGTCGLHLTMLAANIGPGDEVITTPFSFVASANCILYVGATPKFVDIDTQTLNMDVDRIQAAITPRTKAIVAVEAFGHPGGMLETEAIARRNELTLIEDCCEGFGGSVGLQGSPTTLTRSASTRPIGSFGRAGVFGFYPNKQITTGEGGMIVTDDIRFADACRALRNQGREGMAWLAHQRLGYNYRLTEIAAAIGVVQCDRLEEILQNRRRVAALYIERLMTSRFVIVPTLLDTDHVSWFVFVVRLNELFEIGDRDEAMVQLRQMGVGCNNYFPPIHLQPYMRDQLGFKPGDFPVCEYVAARTLALPFFGAMTESMVEDVCTRLEQALEKVLMKKRR
jgi:perosamine synthetase